MRNKRHTLTKTITIGEVEGVLTVTLELVDNGIGAYEFWGQRCTDHQWGWEPVDWQFASHSENGAGRDAVDEWIEAHLEELGNECGEWAADLEAERAEREADARRDEPDSYHYEPMGDED